MKSSSLRPVLVLTCSAMLTAVSASAQQAQQSRQAVLAFFGAQIGNDNDVTQTSCYLGTAGSLVTDGTNDYILSNSHVLAREGAGAVGEDILHTLPSLCDPTAMHVGELAVDVPFGFKRRDQNRVDAALARITPNVVPAVDGQGRVLHIGNSFNDAYGVSSATVDPSVGLAVKKSGRTTGLTHGTISYVGVNVTVSYSRGRVSFVDQFAISSGSFSDGGDSGSLIVTDDAAAHPVGLLFAGSSTDTIGNPIGFVLEELEAQLGATLTFGTSGDPGIWELTDNGGGSGGGGNTGGGKGHGKPKKNEVAAAAIALARQARDRHEDHLRGLAGVQGTGIGVGHGRPTVAIFVESDHPAIVNQLPTELDGVPVEIKVTGEFVAF